MAQLYSVTVANRVGLVQPNPELATLPTSPPPQDIFLNPDGPIGIVTVFSRIHIHGRSLGIHEADVVVFRGSDQNFIGGVALDFSLLQASGTEVGTMSAEKQFDWGAAMPSGILTGKTTGTLPSYFLLNAGDVLVAQLWLFSSATTPITIGWFVAVAFTKLDASGNPI